MCKINWEERTFEVAKDLYVRYKSIPQAFEEAERFIEAYKEAYAEEEKEEPCEKPKATKDEDFENLWVSYRRKGSKKKALEQWNKLSQKDKVRVKEHIPHYVQTREPEYQKDFERYLRDKVFYNVVYSKGISIFNPDAQSEQKQEQNDRLIIGGTEYR